MPKQEVLEDEVEEVDDKPKGGSSLGLIIAILAFITAVAAIALNVTSKPDTSAIEARLQAVEMKADQSTSMMQEDAMEDEEEKDVVEPDTTYMLGYGVGIGSISYPHSWHITLDDRGYADNSVTILTNQRGLLVSAESSGGPLIPGEEYFYDGIQIEIERKLEGDERFLETNVEETDVPDLIKITDECDGAGCPTASYLFLDGQFYIEVRYSDESYKELADQVLASLKK
jgi:hypothetical protein